MLRVQGGLKFSYVSSSRVWDTFQRSRDSKNQPWHFLTRTNGCMKKRGFFLHLPLADTIVSAEAGPVAKFRKCQDKGLMNSPTLFGAKISDLEISLSSGKQFLLVFLVDVCHIANIYAMLLGEMERTRNCMQLIFLKKEAKKAEQTFDQRRFHGCVSNASLNYSLGGDSHIDFTSAFVYF